MSKYRKSDKIINNPKRFLFALRYSKNIISDIFNFKQSASHKLYKELLPSLVKVRPDVYELICGTPETQTYEDFLKCDHLAPVNLEDEIVWHAAILSMFSGIINSFCELVHDYTKSILIESPDKTMLKLDIITDKLGISMWSIENKISLLSMLDGPDGIKKYTNTILANDQIDIFFKSIVEKIGDRAVPSLTWKRYDNIVSTFIKEAKDTNNDSVANSISYIVNYYNTDISEHTNQILSIGTQFPIIDRYITIVRCIQVLECKNNSKYVDNALKEAVSILSDKIADSHLMNLSNKYKVSSGKHLLNDMVIIAFNHYIVGEYDSCISVCNNIFIDNPYLSELYDIYVKSAYRLDIVYIDVFEKSLLNKLLNLMLGILARDDDAKNKYNELMGLVYVNASLPCMANVYYFCCKEFRCYSDKAYSELKRYAEYNSTVMTPKMIAYNKIKNMQNLELYRDAISVEFTSAIYNKDVNAIDKLAIPSYRKSKYIARAHAATGNLDKAKSIYDELELTNDSLTAIEAILANLNIQFNSGDIESCLKLSIDKYFKFNLPPTKLPLQKLINHFDNAGGCCNTVTVEHLIAYDLYNKNIRAERLSELNDLFDEFMFVNGFSSTLDIIDKYDCPNEHKLYFLKYICVPDVMDICDSFQTYNDILSERVKICLALQDIDPDENSSYANEVEEILTRSIVAKASSKIGTGRIYIDALGILKLKKGDLHDVYQKYISIDDEMQESDRLIDYDDAGHRFIPSSRKEQLLISMHEDLATEFIVNPDFGLDGNLSLEVRHGQLESLFWVPLEKLHLVVKKTEGGAYKRNSHWSKVYEILGASFVRKINVVLQQFTQDIERAIDVLNKEWFVAKPFDGYFSFKLSTEQYGKLKEILSKTTDFDEFMSVLTDILLLRTSNNLSQLRDIINNDVPALFEKCFQDVASKITELKEGYALNELEAQIALGKTEIRKAVDELIGMMQFVNKLNAPDFEIDLPLNLSIEAIKTTYSHKYIEIISNVYNTHIVQGRYLHDLARIYLILFDNVIRRSGFDEIPPIKIYSECTDFSLKIISENKISENCDHAKIEASLGEIRKKLATKSYVDNVNKEGKSGFYKIDKILTVNFNCEHTINFRLNSSYEFIVEITADVRRLIYENTDS